MFFLHSILITREYEFINADVRTNGRMSDAGNWIQNEFKKAISAEDNPLNIPPPKVLPGRTQPIPHFLLVMMHLHSTVTS